MSQATYIRLFFLFFLTLIYFLININFFDFYVYRLFESCDFQYSPAKLLLQKKDVFKIYFSSDLASTVPYRVPGILCSQNPHYAIITNFLMIPFALMEFDLSKQVYLILNLFLIYLIFDFLLKKNFISKKLLIFCFVFFILSRPLLTTLIIGQWGIIAFYFMCIFFLNSNKIINFTSIIILSLKYTFFPYILLFLIKLKKYRQIVLLLFLHILCIFLYSIITNSILIENIFLPLKIGSVQGFGSINLQDFFGNHPPMPFNWILLGIICTISYIVYIKNTSGDNYHYVIIFTIITIASFRHHTYDTIFLLPLLVFSLKLNSKLKYFCYLSIFYFWYILDIKYFFDFKFTKIGIFINFIILIINALIVFLYFKNNKVSIGKYNFKFKRIE